MASSVDMLVRYANLCGSKVGGRQALMCLKTSFSKHLVMTGVRLVGVVVVRVMWLSAVSETQSGPRSCSAPLLTQHLSSWVSQLSLCSW